MDKIPFCLLTFYFGLIAKRTLYNQADALNMLLFGTTVAKNSIIPIDSVQANRYIGISAALTLSLRITVIIFLSYQMKR